MIKMWIKALKVIPRISKKEWDDLDIISRWLVASRAAVFIMTATAGEAISRFEAPRGELFYYVKSNGTDMPERVKIRTPSICNWISVIVKAVGSQLTCAAAPAASSRAV